MTCDIVTADKISLDNYSGGNAVYIIELEEKDYWYIGMTSEPYTRMNAHFGNYNMPSSKWVDKFGAKKGYVGYINSEYLSANIIERRLSRVFIEEYGLDRVRGAIWTSPDPKNLPRKSVEPPKIFETFSEQFMGTKLSWLMNYSYPALENAGLR